MGGNPSSLVTDVRSDSRTLKPGELFVALRGETFDGHRFVKDTARLGAIGAVVETGSEAASGAFFPVEYARICVPDTLAALQKIAAAFRRSLSLKAVLITGSNGKTTTKDLTAAVLREQFQVVQTEGNLNNHIGLPLSMLRAQKEDQIGVFEIGMNHPGEIELLAGLARPDVGVITNIGIAHIEFMKTREAIALEKGMLAEALPKNGCLILSIDDEFTPSIAKRTRAEVIMTGIERGRIQAANIKLEPNGSRFDLIEGSSRFAASLTVPGVHMIRNALHAIAVGRVFGIPLETCAAGLAKTKFNKGRLQEKMIRGIRILDDSYNANPDSMAAALQTLALSAGGGRRIALLGKMNELGENSERGHRQAGEAAGAAGIECVISVGDGNAHFISESAKANGVRETCHAGSAREAAGLLAQIACPGDTVLVKGSRSVRMEQIVEAFEGL